MQGQQELIDRLLYVQANEAARCLDEGVLRSVADANVGSILGWGFAPCGGGGLLFDTPVGPARLVPRLRAGGALPGARFEPAACLVALAHKQELFETGGPGC